MTSYGAIEDQRGREAPQSLPLVHSEPVELKRTKSSSNQAQQSESKSNAAAYLIYAIINVIIAVPGYAGMLFSGFAHRWFSLTYSSEDSTDMLQV